MGCLRGRSERMRRGAEGLRFLSLIGIVLWAGIGCCSPDAPPPVVAVGEESCLGCHEGMTGFSPFHNPAAIGCVSCHRGNPADTTEAGSHEGLFAVPGNLSNAGAACGGSCHPDIVERVQTSLMATARGIVAVDRRVFGGSPVPNGHDGMADLGGSHADVHLKQLCYTCHLGYEKEAPAPITELSRGGGCVACHIRYGATRDETTHPALTIQVSDDHCFGCHSRSGRISTNYQGWHETLRSPADVMPGDTLFRLLADGRVFERQAEDVHHARGLACIDCHTSREAMGDGRLYRHQEEATEVRCETCHTASPETLAWAELDREAQMVVLIRYGRELPGRRFVRTGRDSAALVNVFLDDDGRPVLEGKLDGRRRALKPPAEACRLPGHERVSCQSCHASWVAQCIGCHTQRDERGAWQEFASDFRAAPPVLGVREGGAPGALRIEPFAPGMIMTLNTHPRPVDGDVEALAAEGVFHRLYAPAVPHTTAAQGRSCASCHADPLAIGAGRGTLTLDLEAPSGWTFAPEYAPLRDGLPADAWTPFLGTRTTPATTLRDARPFSRVEQQRVLRVGACLSCHPATPVNQRSIYDTFEQALGRMTPACRSSPVDGSR